MSQAVGRMYHPTSSLRRAGDIPHIHPANAHRYHNNYNNAVQVYTVTTRNSSPPHHRPFHNGGGYGGGPPPSPPHHAPRGRRGGRYPPNSYYNSPPPPQQQPYHHPQQPYHHHHHHQQHVQQPPPPHHHPQRQSPPPPPPQSQHQHHHHHNSSNSSSSYYPKNQNQGGYNQPQRGSRGSGYYDDLEWDNYDLGSDKDKKAAQQRKRNERQDGWRRSGNGLMGSDFDLEWDDYDLRPKIEETDDGVELVLPENYLPLLQASSKATLSRGQIPISAIQVRRLPHRTFLSAKTLGFNKDLLVLTTDFPGLGDANETKELLEDALVDEREAFLLSQNNNGPEVCKINGSSDKGSVSGSVSDIPSRIEGSVTDSDSIRDRSQDLTDSDDQTTNDFLDDEYELPCHDRLADVNLYALSPHDFDSPDSIFSRSLADLTDLSLYTIPPSFDPTSITLHQLTNNQLLSKHLQRKQAASKRCIMSNQLAKKVKGSGRKRKFDSALSSSSPSASSKQTSSLDESITIATSPERSGSDDDATVELDFQSGSVSFHAKRHKLSTPPSTEYAIIEPTMSAILSNEAHFSCHGDDLSTDTSIARLQCQTLLTSQPHDTLSPMKAPNASLLPSLTPTSGMLTPADDPLTCMQSHVGVALPGLLKQTLSSSSQDILSPSTHQNVVCHPIVPSPTISTCHSSLSNDKRPFCGDEGNTKADNSGLQFIEDYYSAIDVSQEGKEHERFSFMSEHSEGEAMECDYSQSLKTSNNAPSLVEQTDVLKESRVVKSSPKEFSEDFEKPLEEAESKDLLVQVDFDKSDDSAKTVQNIEATAGAVGLKDHSPVRDIPKRRSSNEEIVAISSELVEQRDMSFDESNSSTKTVLEAKTSAKIPGSNDHSLVEEPLVKKHSAFGKMVPRSVALRGGNVGPSLLRRAKARESSKKEQRYSLLKVGKSSSTFHVRDEDESSKVNRQERKSKLDEPMESEILESVVDGAKREDVPGTKCPSSRDLAVRTELTVSGENEMEVDTESILSKVHLEHEVMDCSVSKDDKTKDRDEDREKEEEGDREGSSCGPLPQLPESYSDLQESGLAAIDLFPTDEEFGVETIRRRRALLSADKEGRDSLLKEATQKLSLKAKKRKRRTSDKAGDGSAISGGLDDGDDKKQKRVAPNYFVAIQVCNPEIHQALHNVQQTVMAGDEKLKDAMVPIPTLHLTIMVMHLATDEDVERAKLALMECHRLLAPEIKRKKLNIWFHGLGHFNNQVMFAKIKDIDGILDTLYNVAETVENCYRRYGIHSTGERGFKPHLTVMKLSRAPSLRKKGVRRIKSELYRAHSATLFGNQPVSGFQLCSINKPKSEDGYYYKAHEVLFAEDVSPIPDAFDLTGMDGSSPKEPITEDLSSSVIEEEPKEPITEPVSSSIMEQKPEESVTEPVSSSVTNEEVKEPTTEPVSSPVEPSDDQTANQTPESQEAKEASKSPDPKPQTSPDPSTEGDKSSLSEPA